MKKNQKLLKAASVMTVLALAAVFPAAAEEGSPKRGWQMEDGRWVFLDGNGDRVTSTWKKRAGRHALLSGRGRIYGRKCHH